MFDRWKSILNEEEDAAKEREKKRESAFQFGIDFLDDALFGIYRGDLVLIGGQTGVGKTQFACNLALNAATQGKKVFYFALEAEKREIELRLLFQRINTHHTFSEFIGGLVTKELCEQIQQALEIKPDFKSTGDIKIFYKTENFGPKDLERELLSNQIEADVFIIDHFHFLDHEYSKSEQEEHKKALRLIRDTALSMGKPVILLAHMNKALAKGGSIIPGNYDFYGTADLVNIATKVLTITGKIPEDLPFTIDESTSPTIIHISKNRMDGSVCRFFALTSFNYKKGNYNKGYYLGAMDNLSLLKRSDFKFPTWAKKALSYENRPYKHVE